MGLKIENFTDDCVHGALDFADDRQGVGREFMAPRPTFEKQRKYSAGFFAKSANIICENGRGFWREGALFSINLRHRTKRRRYQSLPKTQPE
jgi:hypothetical protein